VRTEEKILGQPITGAAGSAAPVSLSEGDRLTAGSAALRPLAAGVGNLSDGELAAWLAGRAGVELMKLRDALGFASPDALKAAGDRGAHELLVAELSRLRPGDAVLSEEGRDDPARLTAERVWIVDPLDGTREFAEDGRTDWAVHVALWCAGGAGSGGSAGGAGSGGSAPAGDLVDGAVALPAEGLVYSTAAAAPPVAPASAAGPVRIAASRTRPPAFLRTLCERIGAVEVPMGSAGAKIIAVVSGAVDAYVHAGGQYEWDSAAPVAVARAAGLHTSRVDGSPLVYNRADPRLPDLVVCRPDLAEPILRELATLDLG
jgi:3'(2'), 5'-bisphosphate nucleotidase